MKIKIMFITAVALLWLPDRAYSQCGDNLVKMAIENLDGDDIFIRSFTVRLDKSSPRKPEPVARFNFYIQNGINYKLGITNAKENAGDAVFQLYKKDEIVVSNLDHSTGNISPELEFTCGESGMYRLYTAFSGGEKGCAVITLSMKMAESELKKEDEGIGYEILYVNTETPIDIYTDAPENYKVEHDISRGSLYLKNNEHYINVPDTGITVINSKVYDGNGKLVEEASTRFKVVEMPRPYVMFQGSKGGIINKINIRPNDELKIYGIPPDMIKTYSITGFKVGRELNSFNSFRSNDAFLDYQQYKLINELVNGDKFYIFDIKIKGPENTIIEIEPLGFILYE